MDYLESLKLELESANNSIRELEEKKRKLQEKIDNVITKNKPCSSIAYDIPMDLEANDISRYSRQLLMSEIGPGGQSRLKNSKVLVIGAGGLGSSVLLYLCSMGVGTIGIVDHDQVDLSNLHRQIIHNENRVGESKVSSARQSMNLLNSSCKIVEYDIHINSENALGIVANYDLVIDATDNLPTRYLINDSCVLMNKPLVYGSALRTEGQLVVYNYNGGPCYRCMFRERPYFDPKQSCSEAGVLGVVPGIIGCLQACEAVKMIVNSDKVPLSQVPISKSEQGSHIDQSHLNLNQRE
ncbi:Adenylyltransferase and sulfurtransferase MOCS3 [Smittium culicis]|uniref:Adenylyltransferase and sulfurtransferase MOCS3 n=1 Tax=Smittium culicis TaxID=133412 RepID=A0A1R1Y6J6_9FUNG|nr:Adenylyltransferase and sulfurtransferase MOCS3 [Smittium culicis]